MKITDTERLDWLCGQHAMKWDYDLHNVVDKYAGMYTFSDDSTCFKGPLREAIDAAIRASRRSTEAKR